MPGMKTIKSGLFLCLFLTGCTHFDGYPDRPDHFVEAAAHFEAAFNGGDNGKIDKYKEQSEKLLTENDPQAIKAAYSKMRLLRDEIINTQIQAYDFEFTAFISDLTGLNVITNTGVEWTSLALAGLTATVGGEATKAALGAANTGVIGAKSSFQKEAFAEKTIPVLITAMISERTKVLLSIRQGLATPVTDYNLYQALSDLEKYYAAGSINGALIQIAENAGVETKKAEDKITEILDVTAAADASTALLRAFLFDEDGIIESNEARFLAWFEENKTAECSGIVPHILTYNLCKDIRQKAVRDFGLLEN